MYIYIYIIYIRIYTYTYIYIYIDRYHIYITVHHVPKCISYHVPLADW